MEFDSYRCDVENLVAAATPLLRSESNAARIGRVPVQAIDRAGPVLSRPYYAVPSTVGEPGRPGRMRQPGLRRTAQGEFRRQTICWRLFQATRPLEQSAAAFLSRGFPQWKLRRKCRLGASRGTSCNFKDPTCYFQHPVLTFQYVSQ